MLEVHGVEEVPDAVGHLEPLQMHGSHLVAAQLGRHGEEQLVRRSAGDQVVDVRNHVLEHRDGTDEGALVPPKREDQALPVDRPATLLIGERPAVPVRADDHDLVERSAVHVAPVDAVAPVAFPADRAR
eukprot:407797-Alexandrium_andersonii.AAC.1